MKNIESRTTTPPAHAGLNWLKEHVPIFAKMVEETTERKLSEEQYKILKHHTQHKDERG